VLPYQEFSVRLAKSDIPKVTGGPAWVLGAAVGGLGAWGSSGGPGRRRPLAASRGRPRWRWQLAGRRRAQAPPAGRARSPAPPPACLHAPACLQIGDILRGVSDAEFLRLRRNLPKYYGAFVWEQEGGGLAYNYTVLALRKRHQYLTASHYKL
jgi:hypothetical protein